MACNLLRGTPPARFVGKMVKGANHFKGQDKDRLTRPGRNRSSRYPARWLFTMAPLLAGATAGTALAQDSNRSALERADDRVDTTERAKSHNNPIRIVRRADHWHLSDVLDVRRVSGRHARSRVASQFELVWRRSRTEG
jgi:hypothetical protein